MLNQITLDKMRQLKLNGMLSALQDITRTPEFHALTFAEGIGLLVDNELIYRTNKRLERLLRTAKLRYPQAMIEDINYEHKRELTHEQLQWLISGQWLTQHQNILLTGPTGVGKTYLACACAQLACRKGITTRYYRLSKLLEALKIAHADGSYSKFAAMLVNVGCLVIDDWGIDPINPERRADLLEIIEDAYDRRSVVISSQLPIDHWHDYIGDHTIADALLDRVIHQAQLLKLSGESMRKKIDPK